MKFSYKSDIGKKRNSNEDYCLAKEENGFYIFIVADGMGGHLAGEVASKLAVESIESYIDSHKDMLNDTVRLITESMTYANKVVYEEAMKPDQKDMGTTCELLIAKNDKCFVGHVGDSRTYFYTKGDLKQVTRDHSLINDLLESGSISQEEAKAMPQKNIITRALGSEETLNIDVLEINLDKNDMILMCTDGVSGSLTDEEIQSILNDYTDLDTAVNQFILKANEAGGLDNSTVILAEKR